MWARAGRAGSGAVSRQVGGVAGPADGAALRAATRANYDRLARWYGVLVDPVDRHAQAVGLRLLSARSGERVLEVGCGTGGALCEIADAVGSSGRAVGVELSPRMAARAVRRIGDRDLVASALVVVAGAPPLPFTDAAFDAVYMSFTLEVLQPASLRTALLAECRRVLVRGGRLVCVSVSAREPAGLASRAYRVLQRHLGSIVDCAPIRAAGLAADAGFMVTDSLDLRLWGLPVDVIRANP